MTIAETFIISQTLRVFSHRRLIKTLQFYYALIYQIIQKLRAPLKTYEKRYNRLKIS